MKEERLSQEHFEAIRQLAEIGTQLSTMRAEIATLKTDKERYFKLRETEAHGRIEKVLEESVEALDAIGKHHQDLKQYSNEIKAYAEGLAHFHQEIVAASNDLAERCERADIALTAKRAAVADAKREIEIAQKNLTEDRKLLSIESDRQKDERRRLKDERETLSKAWKELEAKK